MKLSMCLFMKRRKVMHIPFNILSARKSPLRFFDAQSKNGQANEGKCGEGESAEAGVETCSHRMHCKK